MSELAAEVRQEDVQVLLVNRKSRVLGSESGQQALFEQSVKGVASEVIAVVGAAPPVGALRDLAVRCITLGVAAELEAALFPEQQTENGRAVILERRYLRLLGQLDAASSGAEGALPDAGHAAGVFPPPTAYPDPVRVPSYYAFGPGYMGPW
ncbi:MAG: hypothetical protein WKF93_12390 [Acidimicrobiales bacterium]